MKMEEEEEEKVIHWGEIIDDEKSFNALTSEGLAKYIDWSDNSLDVPPLFQPSAAGKASKKEFAKKAVDWMKPPVDSKGQNYLLHSIELQHYKRRMRYILSAAHSHQVDTQKGSNFDNSVLPSPPPLPKRFCGSDGKLAWSTQPTFLSGEHSVDSARKGMEQKLFNCPVQLDSLSARQILLKSTAAITAHAGFENASETTLNVLTDIVADLSFKFCKLLKTEIDKKPVDTSPVDTFAQVYRKSYSEDMMSLQKFWITRVKTGALKLEKEVFDLLQQYNTLKESNSQLQIKEEKS